MLISRSSSQRAFRMRFHNMNVRVTIWKNVGPADAMVKPSSFCSASVTVKGAAGGRGMSNPSMQLLTELVQLFQKQQTTRYLINGSAVMNRQNSWQKPNFKNRRGSTTTQTDKKLCLPMAFWSANYPTGVAQHTCNGERGRVRQYGEPGIGRVADHSTGNRVLASGNHKLCPCGFRYAALNFSAALRRLPVIK